MSEEKNLADLWQKVLDKTSGIIHEDAVKKWILPIVPVSLKDKELLLAVGEDIQKQYVESRLGALFGDVIQKALGAGQSGSVKADYTIMPLEEGDRAVICTDGVHGVLQDSQIHAIVAAGNGPQGTADVLVKASLEAGTRDNSTAVVVYAGTQSRVTLTTNVMNRMIQPVRPASIQTARRVPRREGTN